MIASLKKRAGELGEDVDWSIFVAPSGSLRAWLLCMLHYPTFRCSPANKHYGNVADPDNVCLGFISSKFDGFGEMLLVDARPMRGKPPRQTQDKRMPWEHLHHDLLAIIDKALIAILDASDAFVAVLFGKMVDEIYRHKLDRHFRRLTLHPVPIFGELYHAYLEYYGPKHPRAGQVKRIVFLSYHPEGFMRAHYHKLMLKFASHLDLASLLTVLPDASGNISIRSIVSCKTKNAEIVLQRREERRDKAQRTVKIRSSASNAKSRARDNAAAMGKYREERAKGALTLDGDWFQLCRMLGVESTMSRPFAIEKIPSEFLKYLNPDYIPDPVVKSTIDKKLSDADVLELRRYVRDGLAVVFKAEMKDTPLTRIALKFFESPYLTRQRLEEDGRGPHWQAARLVGLGRAWRAVQVLTNGAYQSGQFQRHEVAFQKGLRLGRELMILNEKNRWVLGKSGTLKTKTTRVFLPTKSTLDFDTRLAWLWIVDTLPAKGDFMAMWGRVRRNSKNEYCRASYDIVFRAGMDKESPDATEGQILQWLISRLPPDLYNELPDRYLHYTKRTAVQAEVAKRRAAGLFQ